MNGASYALKFPGSNWTVVQPSAAPDLHPHAQAFIDKFRYNAKRASLVQSRIKAMERLGDVETMDQDPDY